jgi:hypothetical protein
VAASTTCFTFKVVTPPTVQPNRPSDPAPAAGDQSPSAAVTADCVTPDVIVAIAVADLAVESFSTVFEYNAFPAASRTFATK